SAGSANRRMLRRRSCSSRRKRHPTSTARCSTWPAVRKPKGGGIMWQSLAGRRSRPVVNWAERGAVRRFAEAIGDPNPLYLDEEAARKSRSGRSIAPPTFPQTFDYGTIEGLCLPDSGLIHGEQRCDYVRPLFVGEEITCYRVFQD